MKQSLNIVFSNDGGVKQVVTCGRKLPLTGRGGFAIEEVLVPDGSSKPWGAVAGTMSGKGASLRFDGGIAAAGLELSASIRQGDYLDVQGEVRDLTGQDRALKVSFTLPVKLRGWRWENTALRHCTIEAGKRYPSAVKDCIYIGRKGDGFADEEPEAFDIRTNKLPYSSVSNGKLGLALAYPVHEPRVFLIEAGDAGYTITFSLGLMPDSLQNPSRATFRFLIYAVDGAWGIRSAAERYQRFFPELFKGYARRHGNVASISNPDRVAVEADVEKKGYAYSNEDYQWSNGEMSESMAQLAKKLDIDVYHWRGPWYSFHEAPGDITREAQGAMMKAQAEGRLQGAHGKNNQLCGCPNEISAQAAYNSSLVDHRNRLERIRFEYPQVSCWLLPMNMDPNLPKPNRYTLAMEWQYRYIKRWQEKGFRGPCHFAWDASDDFSGFRRLNFRREHLRVMETPATFDPASGRVCQVKGFHDWRFAKDHATMVRQAGGTIMANSNLEHSMMYCGAHMDVIFRERRLADHDEERLSVHRMLLGSKPICFTGGRRQPKARAAWRRAAEKALLYAMAPGESSHYEDLAICIDLLRQLGAAGWQPVPHARADGLLVERYGQKRGKLFFAVRNPGGKSVAQRLTIDLAGLGFAAEKKAWSVSELPDGAPRPCRIQRGRLTVTLNVGARRTLALALR